MKGDQKKAKNRAKHDRLLRLFDGEGYEVFHTPKYVFVKQWNGNNETWEVAIYTIESWARKEQGSERHQQFEHLRQIRMDD